MIHNSSAQPDRILDLLTVLYGPELAPSVRARLAGVVDAHIRGRPPAANDGALAISERDAILITYGDQVTRQNAADGDEAPLATLADFCERHLSGVVSGIHILPFFPYTSDDGFSVVDYRLVDPRLGGWPDVSRLSAHFRLMFDAVINHVSASSAWFRGFLAGEARYQDFFIVIDGNPDLSQVVRPRALPLLTTFETLSGPRRVWTTFSADQIDLNYHAPEVLIEIVDTLLDYVSRGAGLIRLDAIAYAWKEPGTACINLPQAHALVQLFRAVLDEAAPSVLLITETNVPHAENITYFGDGANEAQMVYNFALPPLLLHTLQTGSAKVLAAWARDLRAPSRRTTFFNFTASHDGVGLNPARGILSPREIDAVVERARRAGGLVSYKNNPDGSQTPYELNVNYFDALTIQGEDTLVSVARFMASQAIMLALAGVPGLYFHSLFGSRGWPEGATLSGRSRTINRQKLDVDVLVIELSQPGHLRQQVFERYRRLLLARASTAAFHPLSSQEVLDAGDSVFAILRRDQEARQVAICVHNVTGGAQPVQVVALDVTPSSLWLGLVDGRALQADNDGRLLVHLDPYAFEWFIPQPATEGLHAGST